MVDPWEQYPAIDSLGGLGDEALINATLESAKSPTVGDLTATQQSSYMESAGSSGRVAPATIDLGTLPELPVTKGESVSSSPSVKTEPTPTPNAPPEEGKREPVNQSTQLFNPNKTALPDRIQAVGNVDPAAFIIHHTSGRGSVEGVISTLKERHLGVQYVMDRDGNIFATGKPGAANILTGWGKYGKGLSNKNIVGMEIIANDDKDVTEAQKKSFAQFIKARYPTTPLFGHGEVNPGHKEADEGLSAKSAALALRRDTTTPVTTIASSSAPPATIATSSTPPTTIASSSTTNFALSTVRAKSEWLPGEPKTRDTQYGALMENGQPVKLGMSDIAMSPNLLNRHGLKLGDRVDVLDPKNGKVIYPNQRIADLSYYSPNKPTTDTIELWGRPDIGHAQIRKAGEAGGPAIATGGGPVVATTTGDFIEPAIAKAITSNPEPIASESTAKTKPPTIETTIPTPPSPETKPPVLAIASVPSESIETPQQKIAAAKARLRLPKFL